MRPISFVFGMLLTLLGLLDIVFAYAALTASACGFDLSCTHPYAGYSFGWFRLVFGLLLLIFGLMLIAFSFRPRRWGGGWRGGMYGPRYGGGGGYGPGYGPRGMGGMAPLVCPTCGGRNGPRFQHCRFCGAALGGAPGVPGGPAPPLQR